MPPIPFHSIPLLPLTAPGRRDRDRLKECRGLLWLCVLKFKVLSFEFWLDVLSLRAFRTAKLWVFFGLLCWRFVGVGFFFCAIDQNQNPGSFALKSNPICNCHGMNVKQIAFSHLSAVSIMRYWTERAPQGQIQVSWDSWESYWHWKMENRACNQPSDELRAA